MTLNDPPPLLDVVMELVEEQAKQENMVEQQSTTPTIISVDSLRKTVKQIEKAIILSTRNEYQFIQSCKKYFDYSAPIENILSSNQSKKEHSYHISIRLATKSLRFFQKF